MKLRDLKPARLTVLVAALGLVGVVAVIAFSPKNAGPPASVPAIPSPPPLPRAAFLHYDGTNPKANSDLMVYPDGRAIIHRAGRGAGVVARISPKMLAAIRRYAR